MLKVRDLTKSYGGARRRAVLRNIALDIARSEYIAITGESGVGKSTLLNLIAGLEVPDTGTIELDGASVTALDDAGRTLLRRDHIGFVFQAFHLLPHLTVAQNVALPLTLAGIARQQIAARIGNLLAAVGLGDAAGTYPRELSGGEMQRAAIARALVHRPQLLLADEPTGNLDPETARSILALLREQVKQSGGAGILVTHSAAAAATTDRILVLTSEGLRPAS
jgi:putative ABC transport system ATP-binding protein